MLSLLCADIAGISRMQSSDLTDQQMIELLFSPDDPEDAQETLAGDVEDACTWIGVICTRAKSMETIDWHSNEVFLSGSIDFRMIPREILSLSFTSHALRGVMHTKALPEKLEFFFAVECEFSGTIDVGSLPRNLVEFCVKRNNITAIVHVHDLPQTLELLEISDAHIEDKALHIGTLSENYIQVRLYGCNLTKLTFEDADDAGQVHF